MAIVWLSSASAATYGVTHEFDASGTVASSSSNLKYGVRNLKFSSESEVRTKTALLPQAGRITTWIYQETAFPTADASGFIGIINAAETLYIMQLGYDTGSGKLVLRNYINGTIALGSTVLSLATHYRIALCYNIVTDTDWDVKVYLATTDGEDGNLEINVSDVEQLGGAATGKMSHGQWTNASGFLYVAPTYVDDVSDLTDPGDIRVTPALYAAESTNNFDTAIGNGRGATDYNNVNERALSETNGWQHAAADIVEESYTVEGAADADVNIAGKTVIGHLAWIWAKAGGATSGAKLIRNGTDVAIDLTTSSAYYYAVTTSATYPTGTFGMKSSGDANDTFFYEGGALIAYQQGGAGLGRLILTRPA